MGGFNSTLPSGNGSTASGVPLGNAAADSGGFNFAPTPEASSNNVAMRSSGGYGGNWTSQALMPSVNPVRSTPEIPTRNLLENFKAPAPKPQAQNRSNSLFSQIVSEHSSNRPLLSKSLIGGAEPVAPRTDDHGLLGPLKPMRPGLLDAYNNYPQWREQMLAKSQQKQPGGEFTQVTDLLGPLKPMRPGLLDAYNNYPQWREQMLANHAQSYPQQPDPRPDGNGQKPDPKSQVAVLPALAVGAAEAAPYVAGAATAGAAWLAAHPELGRDTVDWFKHATGMDAHEAPLPANEGTPADPQKPPPLQGMPAQPPQLPNKEVFPAQPPQKSDNREQLLPPNIKMPTAVDITSIDPVNLGKGETHPDMEKAIGNIGNQKAAEVVRKHIYGSGILNGVDDKASNVVAAPVPKGQEIAAAKKDLEAFVRDMGGDPAKITPTEDGIYIWKSDDKSVSANVHPSTSRDKQPTFEVQTKEGGVTFRHKRRYYSE